MDDEEFEAAKRLEFASTLIRDRRRVYNDQLIRAIKGEIEVYNLEDLMRLVGTLEAAYNHCIASIAGDGDIYCLLKHLSYAVILCGEMNEPGVADIYEIITIVTNGKIEPCQSCKQDRKEIE